MCPSWGWTQISCCGWVEGSMVDSRCTQEDVVFCVLFYNKRVLILWTRISKCVQTLIIQNIWYISPSINDVHFFILFQSSIIGCLCDDEKVELKMARSRQFISGGVPYDPSFHYLFHISPANPFLAEVDTVVLFTTYCQQNRVNKPTNCFGMKL